jgi:hypothetical protein
MKRFYLLLSLSLAVIIALSSCEGPAGPRGYDGLDGRDGETGIKTVFLNMSRFDWKPLETKGRWFYTFSLPEITSDVIENGAVLCYRKSDISEYEAFEAMPIKTLVEENGVLFSNELWYSHSIGKLDIDWWDSHPVEPLSPSYDMYFKVVILYPTYTYKLKGVDLEDYNAVSKALELDKIESINGIIVK